MERKSNKHNAKQERRTTRKWVRNSKRAFLNSI
jgi:hypothetical protein